MFTESKSEVAFMKAVDLMEHLPESAPKRETEVKREEKRRLEKLSVLYSDLFSTSHVKSKRELREGIKENPFLVFGPGMHNFLKINNRLVCLFLFLSIFALIQMVIFRSFGGTDGLTGYSSLSRWSFGGIGFPTNLCSKAPLVWSSEQEIPMVFECQKGT